MCVQKTTVWKYFGCDRKGSSGGRPGESGALEKADEEEVKRERNKNIATIVMICVIVAIVLTDIITALFWIAVYRKNKTTNS